MHMAGGFGDSPSPCISVLLDRCFDGKTAADSELTGHGHSGRPSWLNTWAAVQLHRYGAWCVQAWPDGLADCRQGCSWRTEECIADKAWRWMEPHWTGGLKEAVLHSDNAARGRAKE